jgi:hypothetical protein
MKKSFILLGIIAILILVALVLRFATSEDSWICSDGKWVKHGNPSSLQPAKGCSGNDEQNQPPAVPKNPYNPLLNNVNDPSALIYLEYLPKQCQTTLWQQYYASGEIKYIKEPTEQELATAYYANKQGIEIKSFEKISNNDIVCTACDVCPANYHYEVTVDSTYLEKMKGLGWEISG